MFLGTVIWVKTIHLWQGRYVFELVIFNLLFTSFMEWAIRSVWWCERWITPVASPKIIILWTFVPSYLQTYSFYLLVSSFASWKELSDDEDDELCFESSLWRLLGLFLSEVTFSVFSLSIFSLSFYDSKLKRVIWVQKFLIVIQTFRQTNFHIDNANQTIKSLVMSSQLSVKVKLFFYSDADQLVFRFFVVGMIEKESKILLGIVVRT